MAVLTPQACVDGIHAILLTVPGIAGSAGVVHKRRRIIRDEPALKALWCPTATPTKVNAWQISPAAANTTVTERHPGHHGIGVKGGGNVLTTFQFQIEGHYQLDDGAASEETFRDLAWAIADEFNAYGLISVVGLVEQLPCDVEQFGYIMVGNFALLHYCRIGIGFRGRTRPNP